MSKRKFDAAAWVDCVDAISGIEIYVGQQAEEEWMGVTFGHHRDRRVIEEGMDRYGKLAAEMNTAPDGVDAVTDELLRRGRVVRFKA
jgi:hypothetical protein